MTIKRCLLSEPFLDNLNDKLWEWGDEFKFDYRLKGILPDGVHLVEIEGESANLEAWADFYDIQFEGEEDDQTTPD